MCMYVFGGVKVDDRVEGVFAEMVKEAMPGSCAADEDDCVKGDGELFIVTLSQCTHRITIHLLSLPLVKDRQTDS